MNHRPHHGLLPLADPRIYFTWALPTGFLGWGVGGAWPLLLLAPSRSRQPLPSEPWAPGGFLCCPEVSTARDTHPRTPRWSSPWQGSCSPQRLSASGGYTAFKFPAFAAGPAQVSSAALAVRRPPAAGGSLRSPGQAYPPQVHRDPRPP